MRKCVPWCRSSGVPGVSLSARRDHRVPLAVRWLSTLLLIRPIDPQRPEARMTKATRKITGPQTERFFRAFYAQEPRLDPEVADALTKRSVATFSSVRVRRAAVGSLGRRIGRGGGLKPGGAKGSAVAPSGSKPEARIAPAASAAAFDPYVFGLVPVFQREGRDGLVVKLRGVGDVGRLRQMARAQQVSLPAELRSGEIDADRLCSAIADAVEKRIADRRAAAGEKT